MSLRNKKTSRIIATGFTTALLGDERTLREFIIGDYVREKLEKKGENVVLSRLSQFDNRKTVTC